MKPDRVTWHFVALNGEVEQFREVAFEQSVAGLAHIAHLESRLNLDQDWDELFVQLPVLHDVGLEGWRLEELDDFSHETSDIHDSLIGRFEERMAHAGEMLQGLGCLHLDLC